MVDQAQILEMTGYPIGAVSPLGLPKPMRILVDRSVLQDGEVSIGSGVRNTTVILRSSDLMKIVGSAEVHDFVQGEKNA